MYMTCLKKISYCMGIESYKINCKKVLNSVNSLYINISRVSKLGYD